MATVLLPILPGTLPPGICFSSEQERLIEYAANMSAQLPGLAYYNFGNTKPLPADNAYPWLNTLDMGWYEFVGVWRRPHPVTPSGNNREIWVGTLAALITNDGGTAGAVTATSGPMWEEDVAFVGRSPIGVGVLPSGAAVALVTDYGNDKSTIVNDNLPEKRLNMFVAGANVLASGQPSSAENCAISASPATGAEWNYNIQKPTVAGDPNAGQTSPMGKNPPDAMTTLSPVRGVYIIKRTARIYITVP